MAAILGRVRGKREGKQRKLFDVFILPIYLFHIIQLASEYFHNWEIYSQNLGKRKQVCRPTYICSIFPVSGRVYGHF